MIFSYKWLQSFFSKKLPEPKKLAELLTLHSFEVEEVKRVGDDWILNIDVLPNRGHDCLCHLGIAREIAAITKSKIKSQKSKIVKSLREKRSDLKPVKLKIKCPGLVPRYTAIIVEAAKVSKSPQWLKKRLEAVGIRSINNIVDLTNFLMLETGQPLHAFDYDKILGQKMILRQSRKGEKVITLDGKNRGLPDGALIIEDEKRLIDLIGIMGGKLSEIDSNTKNIVLQAGNFDRKNVYQTTKKMGYSTDASKIYAHGIDPNLTIPALERAYLLLEKMGGGKIVQLIDIYPKKVCPVGNRRISFGVFPRKIKVDLDYVERLLGTKISVKEIKNILKRLNFKIISHQLVNSSTHQLLVEVPTFRLDINLPEDLIEEIGRIRGYQNIVPKAPVLPVSPPAENRDYLWEMKFKEIFKGLGFNEVYLYSFISEDDANFYLLSPEKFISTLVEIENPTSIDAKYLRPSLLPNLLKAISKNQKTHKEIKLFEIGKVYQQATGNRRQATENKNKSPVASRQSPVEKKILAGIIVGENKFYELKGYIESLFESLGIVEIFFDSFEQTPEEAPFVFWERGSSAEIRQEAGDIEIGFLGKIRDEIAEFYNIKKPIFAFEIDFGKLLEMVEEEHEYEPPSPYPETFRDLSILVPLKTLAGDVIQTIHFFAGKELRDVEVIDIYEGEPIPEDKKNLTFTLIFQSKEKTLKFQDIDKIMTKMIEGLEENIDWEVRR